MNQPAWEWWNAQLPEEKRQIEHVRMSLSLVSEIPAEILRAETWTVATACFESWLLNVRLLTEFFGVHPVRHDKDFSARDFLWSPRELPDYIRSELEACWQLASTFLIHFGRKRVPSDLQELAPLFDTSPANLARIASMVLEVAEAFGRELSARGHDEAEDWNRCVADAIQNLEHTIPTHESRTLRED